MVKCGMSEINITPVVGSSIPGYLNERISTGVKDELYARAMILSKDNYMIALISLDILDIEINLVEQIRNKVHKKTTIPTGNIMICSTHTHTGGPVVNCFATKSDQKYLHFLIEKTSDAAVAAYEQMKPAKIGCSVGMEKDIAFNRRYFMKDGKVLTNPGIMNPLIDRPAGPIDPQVTVLRIDDLDNNPIGVVTNYACHLDVVGGTEFSADYAGVLSSTLKKVIGKDVVSIFLTGASGNINHIDVSGKWRKASEHYSKMGRILAGEVLKVREKINTSEDIKLFADSIIFRLEKRLLSEKDFMAARDIAKLQDKDNIETIFANEVLEFQKIEQEYFNVEVQSLKIGDTSIIGLPGDVFVEFGLRIKEESRFRYNMISTHTNGRYGYIPVREAFEQGGYEVRTTRSNKLEREAGYKIVDNVVKILNKNADF